MKTIPSVANLNARCLVTRSNAIRTQRGMTLIELMVSLVLGLFLIGGVMNIFVVNRQTFRSTENLARMQENARTAFDLMARDLREAGQNPCGAKLVANVIRDSGAIPWWANWGAGTVQGRDSAQSISDFLSADPRVANTDSILVLRAAQDEKKIISHDSTTFDITLNNVDGLGQHDVVIACDPSSAGIFEIDTISTSSKIINHASDTTNNYNCSDNLGYPTAVNCPTVIPSVKTFVAGGSVSKLLSSFWYIGTGSNGKPALFRTRLIPKTVAAVTHPTTEPEEILENVKDLQMEYLTKDISNDTLAAAWIPANDPSSGNTANPNPVFSSANKGWSDENTNQVVAVRITVTLQSDESIGDNQLPIERKLIHVVGLRVRDTLFSVAP